MTCNHESKFLNRSIIMLLGRIFCFLIASLTITGSALADEDAITTYQDNRRAFIEKQKEVRDTFSKDSGMLEEKVTNLQDKIAAKEQKLNQMNRSIASFRSDSGKAREIQVYAGNVFFPMVSTGINAGSMFFDLWSWTKYIIHIGFAICAFNLGLFLLYCHKSMSQRRRVAVIIAMVFFIASITSPLFASDLEDREELITKLELVGKVLSQSDHERFIAILEARPTARIRLPSLASGDNHFSVFREVTTDSPEYWYSLAALYTHEGMKGRTLETTKTMIERVRWSGSEQHQKMILDCIGYLLQEQQTELVTDAIESLTSKIGSPTVLLKLATLLEENGMRGSAEKVLGQAINRARSVNELVELSTFLLKKGELEKGNRALDRAWQKVGSIKELLQVLEAAMEADRDELVTKIAEEVDGAASMLQERLQVVDLFLKNNRKEEATTVFSKMIDDVKLQSRKKKDHLLFLIDASLERSLMHQATNATDLLFMLVSSEAHAMTFPMPAGKRLDSAQGIPDIHKIMLPQFYGLLNEEQGIYDEAEVAYIQDVMWSLQSILDSYGYTFPGTMNSFYLLGRTWVRENRGDLLKRLDSVYTIIEAQFIAEQKQTEERQLSTMRREIETLENRFEELNSNSEQAVRELTQAKRQATLQTLSTTASVLFILGVLIGCFYVAYTYSLTLEICRTFGFVIKLVEALGWVKVMSVLGLVSGLISILFSQFLQLIQQNQENTRKISSLSQATTLVDKTPAITPKEVKEVIS